MSITPSILRRLRTKLGDFLRRGERRQRQLTEWERQWAKPEFAAPWLGRSASKEIVQAVETGWFPPGSRALDIGCGEGEVAAWLADHGHPALGVDIAPSAIARAAKKFPPRAGVLEFMTLDVCDALPPEPLFGVLIDRGCLHQISPPDWPAYRRNLVRTSTPDARMLLFMRAFRDGIPLGDEGERSRVTAHVVEAMGGAFTITRSEVTYLDPSEGRDLATALGGMVYWLEKRRG